jgi:hypothetical protein
MRPRSVCPFDWQTRLGPARRARVASRRSKPEPLEGLLAEVKRQLRLNDERSARRIEEWPPFSLDTSVGPI